MKDKEALEKIAGIINGWGNIPSYRRVILAEEILNALEQLGYRKLPKEKPPLLKVEQTMVHGNARDDGFNAGAQAQYNSIMEYLGLPYRV